ncbi:ATP-binding protein [Actinoplanes sp. NPDC048796]|uniref:ATP-binding protein n=1 Tax=unclassified Actinoplanes TaxID=2626549 RepID=UPI00340AB4A2
MSMSAACLPVPASVRIESDVDAAVALLTVDGVWDKELWQTASVTLRKCLAEHPEALIVDLTGLDDPSGRSAPAWMTARDMAAKMDPPVQLALCIPPDLPLADRMQRLGAPRFLPVYAKVRQARVAIASRLPLVERLMLTLPPEPEAPSAARNLVSDACLAWGLAHLLHPSRTVTSELVTNAVEHARSEMTVMVSLRGRGLHVCVADRSPEMPRLIKPARIRRGRPLDQRGLGLRLVMETAVAWGALPTRTGKVVWATLQPPRAATEPR